MPKRVLDVGQCHMDHPTLTRYLTERFDVAVDWAHLPAQALDHLRQGPYDLVLINRELDEDGTPGIEVLKSIKGDAALRATPVMIVSNFPEAQAAAVAEGAEQGFGKKEYDRPETEAKLRKFLG